MNFSTIFLLVLIFVHVSEFEALASTAPEITIYNPHKDSKIIANTSFTFFGGIKSSLVKRIDIIAGETKIGTTILDKNGLFTLSHIFKKAKNNLFIMIKGFDNKNELIAIKHFYINVLNSQTTPETMPTPTTNTIIIDSLESGTNNIFTVDSEISFTGRTSGSIATVDIKLDDILLDSIRIINNKFGFSYIFGETIVNGSLVFMGMDKYGNKLTQKVYQISVQNSYVSENKYFNKYVLKAVDYLKRNYAFLGYERYSALTHDIPFYGKDGTVIDWIRKKQNSGNSADQKTMCVAAQLEIILTAFEIYAKETGDYVTPYLYNPSSSYKNLGKRNFRGHLWVEPKYFTNGSADAFYNFGMGEVVPFSTLTPGSFVNINRNTAKPSGHAVTFLHYVDINGQRLNSFSNAVKGFRYFSSQGGYDVGAGGLFEKIAFFMSQKDCNKLLPSSVPTNIRDCSVIYSTSQELLNSGNLFAPQFWDAKLRDARLARIPASVQKIVNEYGVEEETNPSFATEAQRNAWYEKFDNSY